MGSDAILVAGFIMLILGMARDFARFMMLRWGFEDCNLMERFERPLLWIRTCIREMGRRRFLLTTNLCSHFRFIRRIIIRLISRPRMWIWKWQTAWMMTNILEH